MSTTTELPQKTKAGRSYAIASIIFGIIGWVAAFTLTIERIEVAGNPNATLSCDISPFISCKSVMLTEQASLFGFPNPLIGVTSFVAPILIGFAVLAGAKFANWFWNLYLVGNALGMVFVFWLFSQSAFVIEVLCPYCMVAWAGMIPLFWMNLGLVASQGSLGTKLQKAGEVIYSWNWVLTVATYAALTLTILFVFWSYWPTLL